MVVEFGMSDLGMMHYFLGLEVNQSVDGIFISQKKYVQDILDRFQMKNCNTMKAAGHLVGYTDSDYARNLEDRKSTSGYAFMLGSGVISWSSKKQPIVTLSTTDAEYVAAASCACQDNPVENGQSKPIDVKYHFLPDLSKDAKISLIYCRSEEKVADIFTKPLKPVPFLKLRDQLGVCKLN
ncbi:uncharacterized mitochondrial protein AtMg00810-like [Capsicum annuum]|uniref:uncharacterized mitochondrial protein AtMg00810-like n=1 Tax=Capsicum annuum TaxID=4072 RepID=UPI001FB0E301|nr:uncharacterized mitochondrial protein AtMg00810-like [Capsicum annuum]